MSLLCETVTGDSMEQLLAARDAAVAADMVELRLDGVKDLDVDRALAGRRGPVIVTCRPAWEGGRFDGSDEARQGILARALRAGADFVDVEWTALRLADASRFDDLVQANRSRVVLSSHDFAGVPTDLATRVRAMRASGAAVIKVAVTAARLSDTLPLRAVATKGDAVVIGMGDAGVPSRLLAAHFGSRWTYGGAAVAPGQMPAARMVDQFRFRTVGAQTLIYGVVGENVMHSLSPAMHNAAFSAAGLDAVYVPLRAADFADFLAFAEALGIRGVSVTIPFKRDALKAAIAADELTRRVGAANTLRRVDGGWEATNTDVEGFLEPLEADYGQSLRGVRASVLGAGGAARAAIVGLTSRGVRVTVHGRRREQAEEVAATLGVDAGPWPPPPMSWDLLVNATPLGGATAPGASPLPDGRFDGRFVYDLTHRQGVSALLRDARRAGLRGLDGLPMLVAQAERQFAWWTGHRPALGVMKAAVS